MEYYDLTNTGPEVQERLDLVPITKADLDQEVLDRIEGDQRVLAESRAYCDLETARAMQVEANLQAQIDAIIGSRLTITITKDVSKIYVGQATTISFVIGTSMDVSSCKLMRGSVDVASSDVHGSNYQFTDTLTVASDIGRVVYSVVAVLNGIERVQTVEIPVEKQTPTFVWNPSGDVTVTEGQYTPSDFPTLVSVPTGLTVVCSSSNPSVATVNSSGVVTVIGVGECTIKAESQATDVYKAKSVSYKLTVEQEYVVNYWAVNEIPETTCDYTLLDPQPLIKFIPGNGSYTGVKYMLYDYLERPKWDEPKSYYDSGNAYEFSITADGVVRCPNMIMNGSTTFNYRIQALRDGQELANLSVHLHLASWDFDWNFAGTAHEPWLPGGTVEAVTVYAQPWHNTPYAINSGLPSIFGTVLVDNISQDSSGSYRSDKIVIAKEENTNQYTVTVTDAITSAIEVRMHATKGRDTQHGARDRIYILKIMPPVSTDYYIGWSKGTSFNDFAAMTAEQLVDLAEPYNKTAQPSITKTVTAEDVSGVTREILFLMWKDGSAPNDGVFSSGGFVEQLSAQDFTNPNIFNASHANVTIEGETFHVSGMRLGFNVGDSLTVNF